MVSQTLRVQISLRQPSTQGTGPVGPAQSLQKSGSVCAKDHLISACGLEGGGTACPGLLSPHDQLECFGGDARQTLLGSTGGPANPPFPTYLFWALLPGSVALPSAVATTAFFRGHVGF